MGHSSSYLLARELVLLQPNSSSELRLDGQQAKRELAHISNEILGLENTISTLENRRMELEGFLNS